MAVIAFSSVIGAIIIALIFSMEGSAYRNVRYISYSFSAVSLFLFCRILSALVFKSIKTLEIYPSYICNTAMNYVNECMVSLFIVSIIHFMISIILWTAVCKLKRKS